MKKIGFVQPNFQQGPKHFNAFFLPYTAGVLLAYAFNNQQVRQNYRLGDIIWRRDPLETTAARLADHDVVGFSTYVWNHQYNYNLARRIKQLNPHVVCVFGGPEIAVTDPDLFAKEPFMDVVIKHEGEETLTNLLITNRDDWTAVPGLMINQGHGACVDTGPAKRIENLDSFPSPYLTGLFDDIIQQNAGISWSATIETNRGCPFQCTFCDWGSLTYNKVKRFNLERVFAELEWIGQHCSSITFTDANFGAFVERDSLILDKLIEVQQQYQNPKHFSIAWAKNQKNEVVQMTKKIMLHSPGFVNGLTVSVQSLDDTVLKNIKRRNLEMNKINEIFDLCSKENIPVYTELIFPLPGETAQSWRQTLYKIFRAGNHGGVLIYPALLLENAEMNLLQKKLYRIETVPVKDYMSDACESDGIEESIQAIASTRDMPHESMLDTMAWTAFVHAFHITGFSSWLARFMLKYQDCDYEIFYDKLEKHIPTYPWLAEELERTRGYYDRWITNGRASHPAIGNLKVPGWLMMLRISLLAHQQNRIDEIMSWLKNFMSTNFALPTAVLEELMLLQRRYVVTYGDLANLPCVEHFDHDIMGFVVNGTPLHQPTAYEFDIKDPKQMSELTFLENIWFGRKRFFGKALITEIPQYHRQILHDVV